MRKWRIRPLHVGTLHRKRSNFLYGVGQPEPLDVPVTIFLLESEGQYVLVDTGCDDPATALPEHHPFERSADQHPLAALKAAGIVPQQISIVINTHLHWDHCYGNSHFPSAQFFVQGAELRYAAAPLPWHTHSYDRFVPGRVPPWINTAFHVVEGDKALLEGLTLLFAPGHTPGGQAVLLEGETARYLIPGDNVPLYDNWEGTPSHRGRIPDTHHYSLGDYHRTFLKMEETEAQVLPSHDFRVFDASVYA